MPSSCTAVISGDSHFTRSLVSVLVQFCEQIVRDIMTKEVKTDKIDGKDIINFQLHDLLANNY